MTTNTNTNCGSFSGCQFCGQNVPFGQMCACEVQYKKDIEATNASLLADQEADWQATVRDVQADMRSDAESNAVVVLTCEGDREPTGVFADLEAVKEFLRQEGDTLSFENTRDGWGIRVGPYTYIANRMAVQTKAEIKARNREGAIVKFAREFLDARGEYEAAPSMGYEPNTYDEETGMDYLDRVYKTKAEALGFNFEEEVMPAVTDIWASQCEEHDAEMRAMLECPNGNVAQAHSEDVVLQATSDEGVHIDDHKTESTPTAQHDCDQCGGTEEVVLTDCSTEYYGSQAWLCSGCRNVPTSMTLEELEAAYGHLGGAHGMPFGSGEAVKVQRAHRHMVALQKAVAAVRPNDCVTARVTGTPLGTVSLYVNVTAVDEEHDMVVGYDAGGIEHMFCRKYITSVDHYSDEFEEAAANDGPYGRIS